MNEEDPRVEGDGSAGIGAAVAALFSKFREKARTKYSSKHRHGQKRKGYGKARRLLKRYVGPFRKG